MVDIELLSSSPSSSSSSISSGSDSSSSNGSTSTSSVSNSGSDGQEKSKSQNVGGSVTAATTNHSSSTQLKVSLHKQSSGNDIPVDTVVCVDSESPEMPLESSKTAETSDSNDTPQPPQQEQQEEDFPFFQSDDSLHTTPHKETLLEKSENDPYNNGFSDEDLARLLDSPEVLAKTSNTTPVATSNKVKVYDSPDMGSSIDTNELEIPRSATPEKVREEAASRFFPKSNVVKESSPQKSPTVPVAKACSNNTTSQDHDALYVESRNPEETRVPPSESELTRQQDEPTSMLVQSCMGRASEVDPSLYQPPPYRRRPDPIVHQLSIHNRPKHTRQQILIKELFSSPLHKLWLSKFDTFNHLQSEVANTLAHSDDSIVVSAPTGAGKTALFEIAMARFFAADLAQNARYGGGASSQVSNQRKIIYVAPSKALCEERYEDWSRRLADMNVGIQCAMITGDGEPGDSFRDLAAAHVILSTPEKFDSLTRRWTENVFLFGSIKLVLLDEVHLLGDDTRGCCLESIVCRMKTIQRAAVAVSGTYDAHRTSR